MKVIKVDLNKNYDEAIEEACRVLKLGGVIVYPTDTVYGLGANACDDLAVDQIFKIKKRAYTKPLPVIVRNLTWMKELVYINHRNKKIVESLWPTHPGRGLLNEIGRLGAVTAVLPRRNHLSSLVTAEGLSVGVRIVDSFFVDYLLGKFGYPLTATSANISGEEPPNHLDEMVARFEGRRYRPNLILDAGILPKTKPSTVLDLTSDQPRILRVGPLRPDQLLRLLNLSGYQNTNQKRNPQTESGHQSDSV